MTKRTGLDLADPRFKPHGASSWREQRCGNIGDHLACYDRRGQGRRRAHLLTWPGHGDPEFVARFEKQYGVQVRVKEYVGGEQMLAAVDSAPAGTFDAVLTDREYIPQLRAADKIVACRPVRLPVC